MDTFNAVFKQKVSMKFAFDEDYLHALYRHDPEIESHFVRYFSYRLKLPLSRRLRRRQVIEDVTQETLYRALHYFRSGKSLRNASNLHAFVFSIAQNVSRELFRTDSYFTSLPEGYENTQDSSPDPELAAIAGERARTVRQELARLPAKDQQILVSVFFQERDKDQICNELDTTRSHFRLLLHRARRRLRAAVEQRCREFDSGSVTSLLRPGQNQKKSAQNSDCLKRQPRSHHLQIVTTLDPEM